MDFAIPLAIVVVVVLLVFAALISNARRRADHIEETREADIDLLRYHVPKGHDPAPVIAEECAASANRPAPARIPARRARRSRTRRRP